MNNTLNIEEGSSHLRFHVRNLSCNNFCVVRLRLVALSVSSVCVTCLRASVYFMKKLEKDAFCEKSKSKSMGIPSFWVAHVINH